MKENQERTVGSVLKTLNEDQEKAVLLLIGQACQDAEKRGYRRGLKDGQNNKKKK